MLEYTKTVSLFINRLTRKANESIPDLRRNKRLHLLRRIKLKQKRHSKINPKKHYRRLLSLKIIRKNKIRDVNLAR